MYDEFMRRSGSLLLLLGLLFAAQPRYARSIRADFVLVVGRSAGFINPEKAKPFDAYRFTVRKKGDWDFLPLKGEAKKGRLSAEALSDWIADMEDAGLDVVESDSELGARDEPYMEIGVHNGRNERDIRIPVDDKLARVIQKRIVELVR